MRIRDAQPDDADAVANIYVASRKVAWRGIIDDEYLDGLDAMHEAGPMRAFLEDPDPGWGTRIVEGTQMLGYLMAGPDDEAPGSTHVGALFIASESFGTGMTSDGQDQRSGDDQGGD